MRGDPYSVTATGAAHHFNIAPSFSDDVTMGRIVVKLRS